MQYIRKTGPSLATGKGGFQAQVILTEVRLRRRTIKKQGASHEHYVLPNFQNACSDEEYLLQRLRAPPLGGKAY